LCRRHRRDSIRVFESGDETLGGAPFNVVFHLHQLIQALSCGEAAFINAVEYDSRGQAILAQVAQSGLPIDYIAQVDQPSGVAHVFEGNGGAAGFEIKFNVAWDRIELSKRD
jgi:sugar/nucleoside kinase (ribokinase family)